MRNAWALWKQHQVLVRWAATVALAVYAVTISQTANDAVDGVQQARADSIRISCVEQNERHDETVRQLDLILDEAKKDAPPEERQQIAQSRAYTVLLIDRLAPKRNCNKRVRTLLNP